MRSLSFIKALCFLLATSLPAWGLANTLSGAVRVSVIGTVTVPMAGATVKLCSGGSALPQCDTKLQETTTDFLGRYSFTLAAGSYGVVVTSFSADTYSAAVPVPSSPATTTHDILLAPKDYYSISGKVSAPGVASVAGVEVQLMMPGGSTAELTTTTDASGNYGFSGIPNNTYDMQAVPPLDSLYRSTRVSTSVSGGPTVTDILLAANFSVAGVVSGGSGPLAGARVELYADNGGSAGGNTPVLTTNSNVDGKYALPLADPGYYALEVAPPAGSGYSRYRLVNVHVTSDGVYRDVRLFNVFGQVTDIESGEAIAGAQVRACLTAGCTAGIIELLLTDIDGNYVLANPPINILFFDVIAAGFLGASGSLTTNGDNQQRNFSLLRFRGIQGTVFAGTPLAGARVDLVVPGVATPLLTLTTDALGAYSIAQPPPGRYDLRVTPPAGSSYKPATVLGMVYATGATITRDVRLSTAGNTLSGVVTGEGEPVSGATVKVVSGTTLVGTGPTDANGAWSVAGVSGGTYDVIVTPPADTVFAIHLQRDVVAGGAIGGDGVLDITLDPDSAQLDSVVLNSMTGAPVDGALVEVCGDAACGASPALLVSVTSDEAGQVALRQLPFMPVALRVSHSGYKTSVFPHAPGGALHSILLTPELTTSGTVSADGSPVGNANVSVYEAGTTNRLFTTTTNASGQYSIPNMSPGVFDVVVSPQAGSAWFRGTAPGVVLSDGPRVSDFALTGVAAGAARYSVQGRVATSLVFGTAIVGAKLNLYAPGQSGSTTILPAASAVSDSSGNFSLAVVPYGTYELQVLAPAGASYANQVIGGVIVGSIAVTQNVVMSAPPATLSGKVTAAADAAAIAGATVDVCARTPSNACGSIYATKTTDAAGNYLHTQIPAGNWVLRVTKNGFEIKSVLFTLSGSNVAQNLSLATAQPVSGIVFGGSERIAGATVKLFAAGTTTLKATVQTDALGRYSLAAVLTGNYDLVLVPPAGRPFLETKVTGVVVGNLAVVRDLVFLDAPAFLTGIIRDANGNPLANAKVEVCAFIVTHECPTPYASVFTDSQGRYSIGCSAGEWFVRVTASGMAAFYWPLAVSSSGNLTLEQDIDLEGVYRIDGKVYGGSSALQSAKVELYASGGSAPLATTTSASNGAYAFQDIRDGLYDLVVTPPAGTSYQRGVVKGVQVDGANRSEDVVLVLLTGVVPTPEGTTVPVGTLAGRVSDDSGTPLAGVYVSATDGSDQYADGTAMTDADGNYEMRLPHASYRVNVSGPGYTIGGAATGVAVAGTTTRDITIAMITVSGQTRSAGGATVANTRLKFSLSSGSKNIDMSVITNSGGNYSVRMPAGVNRVFVEPPAGSGYGKAVVAISPAFTANTTRHFTLVLETTLSGVVRDLANRVLANVRIYVKDSVTGYALAEVTSDASGNYSVKVAPATVVLGVRGTGFDLPTLESAVVVPAGGLTRDLQVPLLTVSGKVRDANGNALAGVRVSTTVQSSASVVSDASGNYSLRVLRGTVGFHLQPSSAQSATFGSTWIAAQIFTGDASRDLVLKSLVRLQGRLTDQHGAALPGMTVRLWRDDSIVASGVTDIGGNYSVRLVSDFYSASVSSSRYTVSLGSVTVNGDTTRNLQLPLYALTGKVIDINGVPFPGVAVTFRAGDSFSESVLTGLTGTYALRLPGFTLQTALKPPLFSGFVPQDGPTISLTGDRNQTFILMRPDTRAPQIVSPPRVTGITAGSAVIVWQTDEPTTSSVIVNGVTHTVAGYRTEHSVALSGLAASGNYTATVSVRDGAGNGPVTGSVDFTTLPPSDARAPTLLGGPAVSGIEHDRVVVRWTTDEAATTRLYYGTATPSTEVVVAGLRDTHEVVLGGLSANTGYVLLVLASDSTGNGPTQSTQVSFRTLPAPDAAAPVIIAGPVVTGVSDNRVTIAWETDEPATSGVSLNDGEEFLVVRDENLVTAHEVTVTGLTPSTVYTFTASSTDARLNGPTLSAAATFRTRSSPDVDPPQLVEWPRVIGITHQSAVVQWRTDETANSIVEYGVAADALTRSVSDAKLKQQHTVQLTDLAADTEYFLRVRSVDTDGNASVSEVTRFRTRGIPDTAAPNFTAAPTVLGSTNTTVTIGWETDEPADYRVTWGVDAIDEHSVSGSSRQQKQRVTLTRLVPGEAYAFAITVTDGAGNANRYESRPEAVAAVAGEGGDLLASVFSLLGVAPAQAALSGVGGFLAGLLADTTVPSFLVAPAVSWTTTDRALLGWASSEPVSVQVTYGIQGSADRRVIGVLTPSMLHSVVLSGLVAGNVYEYEVRLRDVAGNTAETSGSFSPASVADLLAPVLSTLSVSDREAGVAVVNLVSDEPAMHEVRIGRSSTALDSSVYSLAWDRLQGLVLTGLTTGTTYYYQVVSLDIAGNRSQSAIRSFVAGNAAGVGGGGDGVLALVLKLAGDVVQKITVGAQDFVVSLNEGGLPKPLNSYVLRWYVDGVHVPELDGQLDAQIPAAYLPVGTHSVRAELTDTTVQQLSTLRVSQVVTVTPLPTQVTPDLSAFENVVISITRDGREITSAPEGAENIMLRVTGYAPQAGANHTLRWYLDGVYLPAYDNQLEGVAALNPLVAGRHTIRLEMTDNAAPTLVTARTSKFVVVTPGVAGGAGAWLLLSLVFLGLRARQRHRQFL